MWRIVVWTEGRRTETTFRGTKAEAERTEASLRLRAAEPASLQRDPPSFRDFCETIYAPHAALHLRSTTWESVRVYQIRYICLVIGDLKLTEITPAAVERYKLERAALNLDKRKGAKPVGPSTINNELRVLGTIMRFARDLGYPCQEPKWKKLPIRSHPRVRVWTTAQVVELYTQARAVAPEVEALLVFLANTGCRKGEALACEWSWIDMRRRLVCIPSNEVWRPKNGMPREVPLNRSLVALLEQQEGKHERWVFPTAHGGRYANFPKDLFWRARDAAKLTGGVHTLRHTFASHFLERVPDMLLLAEVLGHSSTRVTALYSHLLPGHLERARNAVELAPPKRQNVCTTVGTKSRKAKKEPVSVKRH